LSQTRIIDFLFQNNAFNEIGALGAMCIGDLRIGYRYTELFFLVLSHVTAFCHGAMYFLNSCESYFNFFRPVYKVSHLTKAIVAFQEMATYGTNYLAIVNDSGQLIGNLSASDLKEIGIMKKESIFFIY
jgi:hypothetical protein